jgi:hypothetical protein
MTDRRIIEFKSKEKRQKIGNILLNVKRNCGAW